jgi:hypothetical protein
MVAYALEKGLETVFVIAPNISTLSQVQFPMVEAEVGDRKGSGRCGRPGLTLHEIYPYGPRRVDEQSQPKRISVALAATMVAEQASTHSSLTKAPSYRMLRISPFTEGRRSYRARGFSRTQPGAAGISL